MDDHDNNFFCYLPINQRNIQWDLYLTGIGQTEIGTNEPYPPPNHPGTYDFDWDKGRVLPEYQAIFISEGKGTFESGDTGVVEVKKGNVILLFPKVWHRYHPDPETGWTEQWISFSGEYPYRLFQRGFLSPLTPILFTVGDNPAYPGTSFS